MAHPKPIRMPTPLHPAAGPWSHPGLTRRAAVQAGALGLVGLGMNHVQALRAAAASPLSAQSATAPAIGQPSGRSGSVIFVFLSGGLGQHDSFDLKPLAPDNIRGEFTPIATQTPGLQICEHLPLLASRSQDWSLIRSLTHPSNDHSASHHIMLTGRSAMPVGFDSNRPTPHDWPSLAAMAGAVAPRRDNLPPAVVLPEKLIHRTGRVLPGQFGGIMGSGRDPWFLEAAPFNADTYGAYPEYEFHHAAGARQTNLKFQAPSLDLPSHLPLGRLMARSQLLGSLEEQRRQWDRDARSQTFDRYRQDAISLLTAPEVRQAFDVTSADDQTQIRYGRNSFGWSLLMAYRLISAGVSLVQVNLGNNETWDTHGNAFPHLRDHLFPPFDRGLSALLDDLKQSGLLESTMVVVAGEFGRTPKVSTLPAHYKLAGRDHWGAVQSVLIAGGGVVGGRVIGSSDRIGAYPADNPQTPEQLAATMYHTMGLPPEVAWYDELRRPHPVYYGDPIHDLLA
jgi:hypothetical protein